MFTGIITQVNPILAIDEFPHGKKLWISHHYPDLQTGESIAINGACLTVTEWNQTQFAVDVSPETLARTNLKDLVLHGRVNCERALRLSDRLGGHFVSGHIDETLEVKAIHQTGDYYALQVSGISRQYLPLIIEKGSIALNGVSLTINQIIANTLHCLLIPHTWHHTNFSTLKTGDSLNVEYDMMAKIIQNQLKKTISHEPIRPD